MLSSFLLTYRLCAEYEKAQNLKEILQTTLNYTIRRFFRIYLTVFIFIAFIQEPFYNFFIIQTSTFKESLPYLSLFGGYVSWTNPPHRDWIGALWTIQVEIKFYFILPLICLLVSKFRRNWQQFLIVSSLFYANYRYTALPKDFYMFAYWSLYFLLGFFMAILYINYEKSSRLTALMQSSKYITVSMGVLQWLMFVNGHRIKWPYQHLKTYLTDVEFYGIYWAIHMFIMLVSDPNPFTNWLSNSNFLRLHGKYSFGIYLSNILISYLNMHHFYGTSDVNGVLFVWFWSYVFGIVFYHLVEKNMIKAGNILIQKIGDSTRVRLENNNNNDDKSGLLTSVSVEN
jgi:peptidoglycan/LPS O-acetylase OafA/YrhL